MRRTHRLFVTSIAALATAQAHAQTVAPAPTAAVPTSPPVNFANSSTPVPGTVIPKLLDSYVALLRDHPEVLTQNYRTAITMTQNRTAAQTLAAIHDDRTAQPYSVLNGLGVLTSSYLTGAGASFSGTTPQSLTATSYAPGTLADYTANINYGSSASPGATQFGNGTATPLAGAINFINLARTNSSTEPPKRTFERYQGTNPAISPLDARYADYNALTARTKLTAADTAAIVVPSYLANFTVPAPYANTTQWVQGFTVTAAQVAANGGKPITVPNVGSFDAAGNFTPATFNVGDYAPGIGAAPRPFRVSTDVAVPAQLKPIINATDPYADGAYPSGHTNSGVLQALAVSFLVPQQGQELLTRAADLGNDRIYAGMHSPLDVMGGRIEATAIAATNIYGLLYDANGQRIDWTNPANTAAYSVYQAYNQTQTYLAGACSAVSVTACIQAAQASGATASDPYGNAAANKTAYTNELTYGFTPIGTSTPLTAAQVPTQAQVLLLTRFPYLSDAQRTEVLATTGLPSGYPVLSGNTWDGWGQLNLYAAWDGYAAFNSQVAVTMDAAQGGYSAADSWNNAITGAGGLTKNGSGLLMLTGADTYAGPTIVNGGTLVVTGSITSASTVNGGRLVVAGKSGAVAVASGGTLAGTGTTGAVTVASGGTLAPGVDGTPGTLGVNGTLAMAAGSTLLAPLTAAASTSVAVTGAATLGGAVNVAATTPVQTVTRATLVTATGGVSGQFSGATTTAANTRALLDYAGNAVTLILTRSDVDYTRFAATRNQAAVASALTAALPAARTAGAATLLNDLSVAGRTPATATAALDRLSGESLAAPPAAALEQGEAFMATIADEQLRDASGGVHLWGGPLGGGAWTDGRTADGTADRRSTSYGGELGATGTVLPGWTAGFVGSGGRTNYRVGDRAASGTIDDVHAAAYSTLSMGAGYLSGALAYGHYTMTNTRTAGDGVTAETERATLKGGELRARGELGVRVPFGSGALTPFVGAEYARIWIDGYQEQATAGQGVLALAAGDQTVTSLPVVAGLRYGGNVAGGTLGMLHPYVQAEYRHEFRPDRNAALSFVSLPEAGFTIAAARPAADAFHGAAGIEAALSARLTLYVGADGTVSDGYTAANGRGGLRFAF